MQWLWRRAALAAAKRTPVRPARSRLDAPVASISFDDAPRSAVLAGAGALERAGRRGTWYISGAHTNGLFEGQPQHRLSDLEQLRDAGHEIACHGFAHLDATRTELARLEADRAANQSFLTDVLGPAAAPESFAYPYGATSVRAKRFYSARFSTCRGVLSGLNAGWIDLAELRAFLLTPARFDKAGLARLTRAAWARRAWLVFFTHDVADQPSRLGCRPTELAALIAGLEDAGVEILPVREAARRVSPDLALPSERVP